MGPGCLSSVFHSPCRIFEVALCPVGLTLPFPELGSGATVTFTPTNYTGLAFKQAAKADLALVFVSAFSSEGYDRQSLSLSPEQVRVKEGGFGSDEPVAKQT